MNDTIKLKQWFLNQKRDLPWRKINDPYAVWVSEIMLQQTQVSVVIPYFNRWMETFPTVEKLATASLDQVIKCWEGLGYYSRARNLHEGAQYILKNHQGKLPETEAELNKIKGIGPYTIGAIMSFAFHKKKAAVDGNVIRVLTRYFEIQDDIAKLKTINRIREIAESFLPEHESWIISEALIELGATVCTRNPKCSICPLKSSCKAFLSGNSDKLPFKSTKIKTTFLFRQAFIIMAENKLLVKRGKQGEIMSDLYEFPYKEAASKEECLTLPQDSLFDLAINKLAEMEEVFHSFTRYRVLLKSAIFYTAHAKPIPDYEWRSLDELVNLSFSSGHRKIFQKSYSFLRTNNIFSTIPLQNKL